GHARKQHAEAVHRAIWQGKGQVHEAPGLRPTQRRPGLSSGGTLYIGPVEGCAPCQHLHAIRVTAPHQQRQRYRVALDGEGQAASGRVVERSRQRRYPAIRVIGSRPLDGAGSPPYIHILDQCHGHTHAPGIVKAAVCRVEAVSGASKPISRQRAGGNRDFNRRLATDKLAEGNQPDDDHREHNQEKGSTFHLLNIPGAPNGIVAQQ
ncbi:hypothetical protein HC928_22485, partial [bacterium]|nr:hypothetical protein [bacterium]